MKRRASGPHATERRFDGFLVAFVIALLFGSVPIGAALAPASAPLAGRATPIPSSTAAPAALASASPLVPRGFGAPNCQDPAAGIDVYAPTSGVGGLTFWPLYPYQGGYPCTLTSQDPNDPGTFNDEVHATFSSSVNGSATQWTVPIRLPGTTSIPEADYLNDFYVGMVVAGNASSISGQSYLQVIFTPLIASNGSNEYNVTLSVLGLFDSGYCGTVGTPAIGLDLTWTNLAGCEGDLLNQGNGHALTGPIPGGDTVHVTFNGAQSRAITVYVNDSTEPRFSASYTLSKSSVTDQTAFTSYYNTSCADSCYLNWSMPYGQGFGVDLGSNSLNTTMQAVTNPIWIGSPEYYDGTGYAGDFSTVSFESASGGCSGQSGTIPCPPIGSNWGYPYFQFNGTQLNFGSSTDFNWTTRDFGGVLGEFSTYGTPSDFDPLLVDEARNSSQVGYVTPGSGVNVTVRAQDLGSVASVNLSYQLPDQSTGVLAMSLLSGNQSIGIYQATIPSTGGDGQIHYWIDGTSGAGTSERLPSNPRLEFSVDRTTIPYFTVTFSTNPSDCGAIQFNGLNYSTFQSVNLPANSYPIVPYPCYPYVFSSWKSNGVGISALERTTPTISINLTVNSTLTGVWRYVRPFDTLHLAIDTNHCGSISLNGTVYTVNTTVRLLDGLSYPLSYSQCALNEFSGWIPSVPSNLSILGGAPSTTLTLHGNGTIELTYLSIASSPVSLVFGVRPAGCGGVQFRGAGYVNGTAVALAAGVAYPIGVAACSGWGLDHWNASPGISVSGGSVVATGSGALTAYLYEETIVTIETFPEGCGYVDVNQVAYFGGSTIIVSNGSSFLINATPCSGYYFSGWNASGGVFVFGGSTMTVYYSGILEAVFQRGTRTDFVAFITNPPGCGTISYDGTSYKGSQYIEVPPNSVANLSAQPCPGYGFVSWAEGGPGITIVGNTAYVNGSGSITANFQPLRNVTVLTVPSTCGTVTIATTSYVSGSIADLPAPDVFPISAQPCEHYQFAYWTYSSGAQISAANGTLTLYSVAIVTAVFAPAVYTVRILTTPGNCGSVSYTTGGTQSRYGNNTTVATEYGTHAIGALPCAGFHLVAWNASVGLVLGSNNSTSTTLLVGASGSLTAIYEPVPPVAQLAVPSSAYVGSVVTLNANVTTPVPPYTYTYEWDFGDGTKATTNVGFITHSYALPGTYLVRVTIVDAYHRSANASSDVSVVNPPSASLGGIGLVGYAAIGIAVAAVAAALVLGRRGARVPPSEPGEGDEPPKPSSPRPDTLDEQDGP